jgi:hypothetical protein
VSLLGTGSRTVNISGKSLVHVIQRHWPNSIATGAGKFLSGITRKELKDLVKTTVGAGKKSINSRGRPGSISEYDFGRVIGTDIKGNAASRLRVVVTDSGELKTAFPF